MLPCFFAAGHYNYSRYGLFLVRSMTWLPEDVCDAFMRGEGYMHHMEGLWNGVPTDQFIESTWMRRGKGPSGVIGNTQNPQVMATWVYSLNARVSLTADLLDMSEHPETVHLSHKEETRGRIKQDGED